ncbi:MAG: pyrroline-5-carboxylate reductase, partial [Leptolyngbyaceae cyanobacterium RM2_2_21]|nr:pyrroline-5-carboxylate reductase [Leptolyngbyaceae cyanobacterium RM2_2_21]
MPEKLGIIGGGVMGEALLSRLIASGIYQPGEVIVSDPSSERREKLVDSYDIRVTDLNQQAFDATEAVMLAVKPQIFPAVVAALTHTPAPQPLLVSIMAGVPLASLEAAFCWPIVRAMPNTPATVGAGMTAIALGQQVTPAHQALAQQIFGSVGEVVDVAESLMDAVTGLSGSGPAYVAVMIEALADGGVAA